MKIVFTKHAIWKFTVLKKFNFTQEQIIQTIRKPEIIDNYSRAPLKIAQSTIDGKLILRVVYKQEDDIIKVITFYPGRRKQYEKN